MLKNRSTRADSKSKSSASEFEIVEALEEGLEINPRLGPNRILGKNGRVGGLEVIEVASVFDADGRFNPQFKPGSERVMECDTVILAIGQKANLDALGGADDVVITPRGLGSPASINFLFRSPFTGLKVSS